MKRNTILFALIIFLLTAKTYSAEQKPLAAYKLDNNWYFINEDGKAIFNPLPIKLVTGYSEGFYNIIIEKDSLQIWAFMNDKGEVAVPNCDEIRYFHNGMAMISDVADRDSELKLYGFINKKGKLIVPKEYIDATDYSEGLAWVMNRDKRGYVDTLGRMVIQWDTTGFGSSFFEGMAAMTGKNDKFGFINKNGELVIKFKYDEVTRFVDGYARVNILGKWGFIDKSDNLIINANYDFAMDFVEGFCFVGLTNKETMGPKWGIINRAGGIVTDFQYIDVRDFNQGLGAVREISGKWKIIDYFGKTVLNKEFDNIESFNSGLAYAELDGKKGYINPAGDFVIEIPKEAEFVVDLRLNKRVSKRKIETE